ncbi:MAG: integrase arm-type DNA-binding domain-containing protein [Sphingomonadales bacterium]|nr:integrase arm-type DNA-binding domain-containing protein [Sphingomonadales bacterium]NCQ21015.1 integrase arm-type DNA-binding domain-containing protein [Sphingomonadales bacterium]NCT03804.1 integrase arm-type DNA-binding domain-containing protein [Sphingomonadales bacterium]
MPLKAMEIKAFSPSDKPYRKPDGQGMYLEIRPSGSKLWFLKYRIDGKEKRLGLGSFPDMSLADARTARDKARAAIQAGRDPLHDRKMTKIERRVGAGHTFKSVADDFIQTKLVAGRKAQATIEKARWYLSHLEADIGKRPIAEIKPAELLASLKKIEKRGHHETAIRTRALASRVFRHGVATARCENDPAHLLSGALVTPAVTHRAAITTAAPLGAFLRAVDEYTGGPIAKIAMQLAPHVFLRPGELRQGRWEEIDWDACTWTVPAERTKLRRPHSVPLSHQAITLLRELELHSGGFELMFPGLRSHLRPMSENTMNGAYRRMGFGSDVICAHGLRSTASTLLNESGLWHADAIERALAHGHSDAVRGIYARGQHWDERVKMMQWWSDYLDKVKMGGEVIPLDRALSV